MIELPHTFAASPIDRGETLRRDEEKLELLRQHPAAKFLLFEKLKVATSSDALRWHDAEEIKDLPQEQTIFLGLLDDQPVFALQTTSTEIEFTDCRQIAASIPTPETGILAHARAQLDWHQRNPYCAQCGAKSHPERGGQIRRCDGCEHHIFPRTDPVAIMLIIDEPGGDRCLLGKPLGRFANTPFYTSLAGFLEQGESLEEGVRREVKEEAGITVGQVRYHSSQPWPVPSQLMIGCHGIATTQDINIDPEEMADVKWFSRAEARAAVEGTNPEKLSVPGKMAIAHHLIGAWVYGEVDL
jgi:NAD+ diphosphatase